MLIGLDVGQALAYWRWFSRPSVSGAARPDLRLGRRRARKHAAAVSVLALAVLSACGEPPRHAEPPRNAEFSGDVCEGPRQSSSETAAANNDLPQAFSVDRPIIGRPDATKIRSILATDNQLVAVGSHRMEDDGTGSPKESAGVWTSTDGGTWESVDGTRLNLDEPGARRTWYEMAIMVRGEGGGLIAAGTVLESYPGERLLDGGWWTREYPVVWRSSDGRDWQMIRDATLRNGRSTMSDLLVTDRGLIAVGSRYKTELLMPHRNPVDFPQATAWAASEDAQTWRRANVELRLQEAQASGRWRLPMVAW